MRIQTFELPPIGTNAYLLINDRQQTAVLVDAPLNAYVTVERVLVREGLKLDAVLLTHGHWDHTLDGWRFNAFGTPIYAHRDDAAFLSDPQSMSRFSIPGLEMRPLVVDHWVEHGQLIDVAGMQFEVRHVPGHSPGSVLYWNADQHVAASGDVVFQGSVGRTDFPGCSFEQLEASILNHVYSLPDRTALLPGHGPATDVATERATNPFVRGAL